MEQVKYSWPSTAASLTIGILIADELVTLGAALATVATGKVTLVVVLMKSSPAERTKKQEIISKINARSLTVNA